MQILTESLRSFVMRIAGEANAPHLHGINNVLLVNFSSDVIQRLTRLNMDTHAGTGVTEMPASADKLSRDAGFWTHLAGDSVQRMRAVWRKRPV